ncbi:HpcH/HpaI aldolase/citrate lyase family protein [Streptomyces sp. NPDC012794]|uniref:HpcH/HpaI aldolase/citrate lyase family protein n=1 Tax=Streptomyces sp. NPDC012794 TaxID=3364850 RepID=UPI0036C4D050
MTAAVHRSYLYVPAHKRRVVEKAYASQADAVVLDLEDAVPLDSKDDARRAAAAILTTIPPKPTYVRVNPVAGGLARDDVRAVALPGLAAIRLPKVEHPQQIREAARWLEEAGSDAGVQILVESALGVEALGELARATPRLERIGLGENDLRADLRTDFDGPTMDAARVRCVFVSRAAGLVSPAMSVYPRLDDPDGLRRSCLAGRAMGYLGRFAVHPSQLAVINEVFTPSVEEAADARAVLAAAASRPDSGSSVFVTADGRTVAPPLVAHARAVLTMADALSATAPTP